MKFKAMYAFKIVSSKLWVRDALGQSMNFSSIHIFSDIVILWVSLWLFVWFSRSSKQQPASGLHVPRDSFTLISFHSAVLRTRQVGFFSLTYVSLYQCYRCVCDDLSAQCLGWSWLAIRWGQLWLWSLLLLLKLLVLFQEKEQFLSFQFTESVQCHNHKILGEFDGDPYKPCSYI